MTVDLVTELPEGPSLTDLLDEHEREIGTPDGRPAVTAPPVRPPMPPADPKAAPHGWAWDAATEQYRAKAAPGRPAKVAPRRAKAAPAKKAPAKAAPAAAAKKAAAPAGTAKAISRADVAMTLVDTAYLMGAATPIPDELFGRPLAAIRTRVRLQAQVLADNAEVIAAASVKISDHNAWLARKLDAVATGEGGLWVVALLSMVAPVIAQSVQVWMSPVSPDMDELAGKVEENARGVFAGILAKATVPVRVVE